MAIDIKQEQFKKMLKTVMPSLSLLQNEGIALEEAKEKLLELFLKSEERKPNCDLSEKIGYICYYFRSWLLKEKKIPADREPELSRPLYKLLSEAMVEDFEHIENKESSLKAKIISFPENLR
jgi:hypothetical protein